jgi:hypothetical protein
MGFIAERLARSMGKSPLISLIRIFLPVFVGGLVLF